MGRDGLWKVNQGIGLTPNEQGAVCAVTLGLICVCTGIEGGPIQQTETGNKSTVVLWLQVVYLAKNKISASPWGTLSLGIAMKKARPNTRTLVNEVEVQGRLRSL